MKRILKILLKFSSVLLGGIFLGAVLLVFSFCLPEEPMQNHLRESIPTLTKYLGTSEMIVGYQSSFDGSFTDGLMLQNAVYDEGHTLLEKAMGIYRNGWENDLWYPRETLVEYLNGVATEEYSYARYWHGYLVALKPMLVFFNLEEIYFFNQIAQALLLMFVVGALVKKNKTKYAVCYGITYLFLVPVVMPMTLSLSMCFYLYLIINCLQMCWHDKWVEKGWYAYVFLVIGMVTSYVDFLTYPIVTLGIPMVMFFVLSEHDKIKQMVGKILTYSATWGIGYIGMWASKWFIGSLILKENILQDAGNTLAHRMDAITYDSRILSFFSVVWYNMKMYKALPYILLVIALLVAAIIMAIKYPAKKTKMQLLIGCIPYAIIALMPFVWYAVALNHSGEHYMFTFRALIVTVFAGSCMLMNCFECNRNNRDKNKQTSEERKTNG
ncbi:MAG: hypothetical protein J6C06_11220 [Lachnospiraceae bacterium]|nr:hypothetical protein [Lachnospiraceae bacterium]